MIEVAIEGADDWCFPEEKARTDGKKYGELYLNARRALRASEGENAAFVARELLAFASGKSVAALLWPTASSMRRSRLPSGWTSIRPAPFRRAAGLHPGQMELLRTGAHGDPRRPDPAGRHDGGHGACHRKAP